jgi:hypothetical protein
MPIADRLVSAPKTTLAKHSGDDGSWRFLPVQINSSSVNFPPWSDVVVMQQQ